MGGGKQKGGCLTLFLVVGVIGIITGAGSSSSSRSTTTPTQTETSTTATANPAVEAQAQHRAEAIYERDGLSFYIGAMRASTVRFSFPCRSAKEGEEGHETPIPGKWDCAGWGLITSGELEAGKCEFVEGNVTATGLAGKPKGDAMTFAGGSPCQLNLGLGITGRRPSPTLVASWAHNRNAEVQHVREQEATPEAQARKREQEKEEAEEAARTKEAEGAERGE